MSRRTVIAGLIALFVLALAVRLGAMVYLKSWANPNAIEHRAIATALVRGEGFSFGDWGYFGPTSVQSPTYPYLLAGAYKLFGTDSHGAYAFVIALNCVISAASVLLLYALVRVLGGSAGVGLLAAGLLAIWPSQIYAALAAQAISMIIAGVLAMVVLFYQGVRTGKLWPWVGYSLVAVFTALTEPALLVIAALSGVMVLGWPGLPWGVRVRNGAILLAVTLAMIGPWAYRNYLVHGRVVPVKSTFWVNIWKGNNPHATGTDRLEMSPELAALLKAQHSAADFDKLARDAKLDGLRQYDMLTAAQKAELRGKTEMQREEVFKRWATQWISENRGRWAELMFIRLGKTLWIEWDNPKSHHPVYVYPRSVLVVLSALGLVLALRKRWTLLYPLLLIGSCLLLYALTQTAARFSLPFEPIQLAWVALLMVSAAGCWRGSAAGNAVGREVTQA